MTITWATMEDNKVCPICRPLHGASWTFDTKTEEFPQQLVSPSTGKQVWDTISDHPTTHDPAGTNCRCRLTITFNVEEIQREIRDKLTWAIQTKILPPSPVI